MIAISISVQLKYQKKSVKEKGKPATHPFTQAAPRLSAFNIFY
jgi:hypothetical protein